MSSNVVLDTNVLVAAGFNTHSHAARILAAVEAGELTLVWNETTRAETLHTLNRISPLAGRDFAALFRPEAEHFGTTNPAAYPFIPDPADRAFAALAEAAGAPLITNDAHLLNHKAALAVPVLTPRAFWEGRSSASDEAT